MRQAAREKVVNFPHPRSSRGKRERGETTKPCGSLRLYCFCLAALRLGLGLLAYAMYVLLGIMLVSRWLARHWVENLTAVRECNRYSADIGDTVAVVDHAAEYGLAAGRLGAGRGLAAAAGAATISRPACRSRASASS